MKLLSIAIPCFNSAAYMRKCIDSLLIGGEEVEILIVNDGSTKDNTKEIADEYVKLFIKRMVDMEMRLCMGLELLAATILRL